MDTKNLKEMLRFFISTHPASFTLENFTWKIEPFLWYNIKFRLTYSTIMKMIVNFLVVRDLCLTSMPYDVLFILYFASVVYIT